MLGATKERRTQEASGLGLLLPESELPGGFAEWPRACFHDVPLKTKNPKICLNQGEGRGQCIWCEQGGSYRSVYQHLGLFFYVP